MRLILTLLIIIFSFSLAGQEDVIASKTTTKLNFQGKMVSRIVEEYNNLGHLVKQINYAKRERTSIRTFEYDSNGLLVRETGFSKHKEIQEEIYFIYDTSGQLLKRKRYYPLTNRVQVEIIIRLYNENGRLYSKVILDQDSTQKWAYQFEYDHNGEITRQKSVHKGEMKNESIFLYDCGNIIEEKLYAFDNPSKEAEEDSQIFYDYNESGHLVKKTILSLAELLARPLLMEEDIIYNDQGYISRIKKSNNGKLFSEMNVDYTYY